MPFKVMFLGYLIVPLLTAALPPEALEGDMFKPCNPDKDFSSDCQLKAAECQILDHILHGIDGSVMTKLLQCSSNLGVEVSPDVLAKAYTNVKKTYMSPYDAMDSIFTNKTVLSSIRKCVLDSSKLLTSDGHLDRTHIARLFRLHLFWTPRLQDSLSKAAAVCPEPIDFDMRPFISCLKRVCLSEVPGVLDYYLIVTAEEDMFMPDLQDYSSPVATGFAF